MKGRCSNHSAIRYPLSLLRHITLFYKASGARSTILEEKKYLVLLTKLIRLQCRLLPAAGVILHLILLLVMSRTRRLLRPEDSWCVDGFLGYNISVKMLNQYFWLGPLCTLINSETSCINEWPFRSLNHSQLLTASLCLPCWTRFISSAIILQLEITPF